MIATCVCVEVRNVNFCCALLLSDEDEEEGQPALQLVKLEAPGAESDEEDGEAEGSEIPFEKMSPTSQGVFLAKLEKAAADAASGSSSSSSSSSSAAASAPALKKAKSGGKMGRAAASHASAAAGKKARVDAQTQMMNTLAAASARSERAFAYLDGPAGGSGGGDGLSAATEQRLHDRINRLEDRITALER